MTVIIFYENKDGDYDKVVCSGHSGYAEEGNDIVCAAVSSVMQFMGCMLLETMDMGDSFAVDEDGIKMTCSIQDNAPDDKRMLARMLFFNAYLFFVNLKEEYPKHIQVVKVLKS